VVGPLLGNALEQSGGWVLGDAYAPCETDRFALF